ncbi:MAG: hypothetical protein WBD20_07900 [Pirellulaceae bacterium]
MLTIADLTADSTNNVSQATIVTPVETLPSDAEISRRVLGIRSKWSVQERIARRREADSRFADLLCALIDADVAA